MAQLMSKGKEKSILFMKSNLTGSLYNYGSFFRISLECSITRFVFNNNEMSYTYIRTYV